MQNKGKCILLELQNVIRLQIHFVIKNGGLQTGLLVLNETKYGSVYPVRVLQLSVFQLHYK